VILIQHQTITDLQNVGSWHLQKQQILRSNTFPSFKPAHNPVIDLFMIFVTRFNPCGWVSKGGEIGIVGNDGLNVRYSLAVKALDVKVIDGGENAAIKGELAIAKYL